MTDNDIEYSLSEVLDWPVSIAEFNSEVTASELERLLAKQNPDALMRWVFQRSNTPEFMAALDVRDNFYKVLRHLLINIKRAKGYLPYEDGSKRKSYVAIREATLPYRSVFERLSLLNASIDEYKSFNAMAAEASSCIREQQQREAGTFLTYTKDTIGSLVAVGDYESGSAEWHHARNSGIGGSDIHKILKSDPEYGARDYHSLLLQKVGLSILPVDDDSRLDKRTAVGRGNAWEEAIRHMYMKNSGKRIAFCKTSWAGIGEFSYCHANFDGLELDDTNTPVGIVEIKTGVHNSSKWGDPEDGFGGMPVGYRQQAIWYAGLAGLKTVTLVAVLDDYDYREYHFNMDDPRAVEEWNRMKIAAAEFWHEVETVKKELAAGVNRFAKKIHKGFPKSVNMKDWAYKVAAYSGDTVEHCYQVVRDAFAKVKKDGSNYSPAQIQSVLTSVYAAHNPSIRKKPIVGIDLETSAASPAKGRILETAIVQLNPDGNVETLLSTLHGISADVIDGVGVGLESLHRITPDMVANKPEFEDEANVTAIWEALRGAVLVAHNATFEKEFLAVNLPGFAEALDNGSLLILDTRQIASHLMVTSIDNSLQSFSEGNGVPYVDAHAAEADTVMMMKALYNFQSSLHHNGVFVPAPDDHKIHAEIHDVSNMMVRR